MRRITRTFAVSHHDRRTLGAGVLAIALILVVGQGLPAWRAWRSGTLDAATREQAALARTRALVDAEPAIHDSLAARALRLTALRAVFLSGETPGTQGASLAARITQTAESAHVTIGALGIHTSDPSSGDQTSLRSPPNGARAGVQPSDGRDPLVTITVQGSAAGDIQGLATFLALLEKGRPAVAVREVTLTQPDVGAPRDRAESLHLDFLVEGIGASRASLASSNSGRHGGSS
jgi:hypothetical protein